MRWVVYLWFAMAGVCSALDTVARVGGDAAAARVLEKNPIRVEAKGSVPIAYADAVRMFASPTLLADVQAEYARLLPEGEEPEFVITQTSPVDYHYVNKSGQETAIREVHRAEHEGPTTEVVFHAKGRRFFGDFQAVIHIAARPAEAGTDYTTRVYAYPENSVSRFFARHLRLVKLFFNSKTEEIEKLSIQISRALTRTDVAAK